MEEWSGCAGCFLEVIILPRSRGQDSSRNAREAIGRNGSSPSAFSKYRFAETLSSVSAFEMG
jgi:hypothetical protein